VTSGCANDVRKTGVTLDIHLLQKRHHPADLAKLIPAALGHN